MFAPQGIAPSQEGPETTPVPEARPVPAVTDARSIAALIEALAALVPAAVRPAEMALPEAAPSAGLSPEEVAERASITRKAEAISRLRGLEDLKAACAAARARETAALRTHRLQVEADRGLPENRRGLGLGSEIGLARRATPQRGSIFLRQAVHLTEDLPNTLDALQSGRISEEHAAAVERHTHWLPAPARRSVDDTVAERCEGLGIRRLVHEVQGAAHLADPEAAAEQYDESVKTRHVRIRPTEFGMATVTALLPAVEAAACHRALTQQAATELALGNAEGRTLQQIISDAFVQRLNGRDHEQSSPVEVQLVMTDRALLEGGTDPALVPGHGPLPASVARKILRDSATPTNSIDSTDPAGSADTAEAAVFIRRLYTAPDTGQLVAMD